MTCNSEIEDGNISDGWYQGTVSDEEFAERYALFCTVQVPANKLNNLFELVQKRCPSSTGTVLRLITSQTGPGSLSESPAPTGGTRPPIAEFQTPFVGLGLQALREEFQQGLGDCEGWADTCFAVLDERFLRDGTVLLVSIDQHSEEDAASKRMLNHRCDPGITLDLLLFHQTNYIGEDWHDDDSDGVNWVHTYDYFDKTNGAGGS